MKNSFTPNDLIRFIYRETSDVEDAEIRLQLAEDSQFAVEFHRLIEAANMLDQLKMEPSETSVNLILEFSREQIEEASHA